MPVKKFSHQKLKQIIPHLEKYLPEDRRFNLKIDLYAGSAEIKVSRRGRKRERSDKMKRVINEASNQRPRNRKLASTRKRHNPKIRSSKKLGRVIKLKGRTGMMAWDEEK